MKALAKKRGRPRNPNIIRAPSGQASQSNEAKDLATRLAVEAATWRRRKMVPFLSPEEARKQEWGSVIDMWLLESQRQHKRNPGAASEIEFTRLHYDTAVRYGQLYRDWLAVIEAKRMRSSSEFGQTPGYDGRDPFDAEAQRRAGNTEDRFKAARRAILESGPLGMMAIETIVIENHHADKLRGDLRMALNALGVLWRLQAAA